MLSTEVGHLNLQVVLSSHRVKDSQHGWVGRDLAAHLIGLAAPHQLRFSPSAYKLPQVLEGCSEVSAEPSLPQAKAQRNAVSKERCCFLCRNSFPACAQTRLHRNPKKRYFWQVLTYQRVRTGAARGAHGVLLCPPQALAQSTDKQNFEKEYFLFFFFFFSSLLSTLFMCNYCFLLNENFAPCFSKRFAVLKLNHQLIN